MQTILNIPQSNQFPQSRCAISQANISAISGLLKKFKAWKENEMIKGKIENGKLQPFFRKY